METIKLESGEQVIDDLVEALMVKMKPGDMVLVSRYEPTEENGRKVFTIRKAEGGVVNV